MRKSKIIIFIFFVCLIILISYSKTKDNDSSTLGIQTSDIKIIKDESNYIGNYKDFLNNISITISKKNETGRGKAILKSSDNEIEEGTWGVSQVNISKMFITIYIKDSKYIVRGFIDLSISNDYKSMIVTKSDFPNQIPINTKFIKIY